LIASVVPDAVLERGARRQRREWERRLPTAPHDFEAAYQDYWASGEVPENAEELLFLATWGSGGTFPREQAAQHAAPFAPEAFAGFDDDLLSAIDPATVAASVREHGFYLVPDTIRESAVDDIRAVLEAGPAAPRGDGLTDRAPGAPAPTAPTWWMAASDTVRSPAARQLLRERRLAEAGGLYLGADPMIMSVVLWKSFAWDSADSGSAQQFHYDGDRSAFVKMFVYLTDVDATGGAHTYVPGSHREKPKELLHGGRLTDEEIARHYPRETWEVITGPKGTVFFADTQGFHKGGKVEHGARAMFQVNLAVDRFGGSEPPVGPAGSAPPDLQRAVSEAPRYFSGLFTQPTPVP
jgi:hypothetical protein